MTRKTRTLRTIGCLAAAVAVSMAGLLTATAQQELPAAGGRLDPSDVYFQGWLLSQDGDKLREDGKALEALEKYRRASELFDNITQSFPEWRSDMVERRLKQTYDDIASVAPEAGKQQQENEQAIAELEGGVRRGAGPEGPATDAIEIPLAPDRAPDTLKSRRIVDLEREVSSLMRRLDDSARAGASASSHQDLLRAQLRESQRQLDHLRRDLAEAPVHEEMAALSRRIEGLEQEKDVMSRALDASRAETREAQGQINALQAERTRLMQELADLNQNIELERKTSNEVVAGQRRQLEHMQELLKDKDLELGKARGRIRQLETEIAEVRASFEDMRGERDALLRERDQMAALLNLNESAQLQAVIDQNLALDRELREQKERYDKLQDFKDASEDDLREALRDLAISKLRIQEFRQERRDQEQRMEALEARLRHEEAALAGGQVDSAEAEMLRRIIHRQLKVQEKREEARELLLSTLGETAREDESLQRALTVFQGAELNLSPEEMRVLEAEEVDGVIVSPYARPRDEVARNMASLERDLVPYQKAGLRAYQNNRLHAAREAFEMVIERNPGDSGTMCKLGLVQLRLDDPFSAADLFQRACELDSGNPYAFRMLGHSLSMVGDQQKALAALERSVELAPTRFENHLLLGNLRFRTGDLAGAEESLLTASSCNEISAEPHYNLAVLYSKLDDRKRALDHYARALELGAAPNLELEQLIGTPG